MANQHLDTFLKKTGLPSAFRKRVRLFIFLLTSSLAVFTLPGTASAQETDDLPTIFHHDFRNQPLPGDLKLWNVQNPDYLQFQPEGLLIKVPKTFIINRGNGVGVQTTFGLKGDFDITLAFDNLQMEAPGSEVGVGLAIDMTAQNGSNVKHSRVLFPEENKHAIRSNFWHDKNEDYKVTLAPETAGRLRFQRTGPTLFYWWAPGTQGDDFKKVFQCELGTSDIKFVRLDVYTGGIPRDVAVRLLDLQIRGQKDGKPLSTAPPSAPKKQAKEPASEAPKGKPPGPPPKIEAFPFEFYHDFRGQPKPAELTWFGVKKDNLVKEQPDGLRITLPKTFIHDWGGVGITTAFGFKGDFEVTTSFEILQADKPPGNNVRVGVLLAVSTGGDGIASLARVINPKGEEVVFWDWHHDSRISANVTPCTGREGRLRLKRTGNMLYYLWGAGTQGEDFQEIKQCEYGNGDIEHVRLVATTGRTPSTVDVRLLDLRIRTQSPGDLPTPSPKTSGSTGEGPTSAPKTAGRSALWILAILIGGIAMIGGLLVWLRRRSGGTKKEAPGLPLPQRRRAKESPKKQVEEALELMPEPVAGPVYFQCSGCEKKLRAKAELRGKKIKCPQCAQAVLVP